MGHDTLDTARNTTVQQLIQDPPCGLLDWTLVVYLDLNDYPSSVPLPGWRLALVLQEEHPILLQLVTLILCGSHLSQNGPTVMCVAEHASHDRRTSWAYLDGVCVTYGTPRRHIWNFGAGYNRSGPFRCPCDNPNDRGFAPLPPSFVGTNYFCDGEYNGALWDGMDCTVSGCCTFNSPPWFSVTLPPPPLK